MIRFYSAEYLEPPKNKGSYGSMLGYYTELTTNLPPFTVDIQGYVEDYKWLSKPSIKIEFPESVPDIGIKPLSFWEKNVLKPVQSKIKEVEIIITKLTGKSPKIIENILKIPQAVVKIWNKIKSAVSKLNPFGAEVSQPLSSFAPEDEETDEITEVAEVGPPQATPEENKEGVGGPTMSLEEAQEQLDDIAERIDVLEAETAKLAKEKGVNFLEIEEEGQENEAAEEKIEEEKTTKEDEEEAGDKDVCSVDINTASKEDLEKITGVGPTIAQRITEARPFYSIGDLTRVSGIGEITLQKIIAQGCAYVSGYVGAAAAAPPPSTPSTPTYSKILISEIQASPIEQRFIELYNPNSEAVNLTDWYLQRKTGTSTGWTSLVSSTHFEGKTIQPAGHFLIASSSEADIVLRPTLTENNSLALKNPNREVADLLGWGNAQEFETATATNPEQEKSLGRKWSTTTENYIDTDNNQNDFELQTPTPKVQNQSPEPEPVPEQPLLSVAINEIAWMGTNATNSSDEWIELYNNTTSTIDLAGWTLSATDGTPLITFSASNGTTTISALGFYLLERTNDQTISDISADQIYTGALENDGEKLELRDSNNNLIDAVDCSSGWFAGTTSPNYISMERINPNSTGTVLENWANNNVLTRNGRDAAGNPINGTPKAQNSVYQSHPPNPVLDFAFDSQNSYGNRAVLRWSTSTDPDTLSENLSYVIYYSKDILNENNLVNASTSSTTATTILISGLDYSSVYYFGIKVFDGRNYSLLATTSPYQAAILSTIAADLTADSGIKNNGRKIARTSNGNLYVVYFKDGKIFLAKSTDTGESWSQIPATPNEEFEQKEPVIAVDSQNNLHIVWQGKISATSTYQIRYRKYDGTSFSVIEDLTNNSEWNQETPVIAIDSQDNIHIIWVNAKTNAPKLSHLTKIGDNWLVKEGINNNHISIGSLNLAIDSQDYLHLVWQAMIIIGPSWHLIIRYQKYTDSWQPAEDLCYASNSNFTSLVVDGNDNVHFVWNGNCDNDYCYISYKEHADSQRTAIASLPRFSQQDPQISLDSRGYLYVVWNQYSTLDSRHHIYFRKYTNSWQEIQKLEEVIEDSQKYPNLIWAKYPTISGKKTNQPETGFAFIFYQGTELKFYQSEDLAFE